MLLRLWARQKFMAELQKQPAPCSRDWKIQVKMKKAGRKKNPRGSEGERFICNFEALLDKKDPPDTFSQYLFVS